MSALHKRQPLLTLALDRGAVSTRGDTLHRQLYGQIRELVLSGRLSPGARLPSTRGLAQELRCSRNTVIGAFEQLLSEGYLEGRHGSGTFVSRVLPDDLLSVARPQAGLRGATGDGPVEGRVIKPRTPLSRRGRKLTGLARGDRRGGLAFTPGIPELGQFPFEVWGRLLGRTWRRPPDSLARHGDAAGYRPLRQVIAQYLSDVRALRCDWRQVVITSGAQQGMDLAARLLLDPGDTVWIEDPGYAGLRGPLLAAGAKLVPLSVDPEGMSVAEGRAATPHARLAVVTPSHQYPLGVTMSLARRLDLLNWARAAQAWVLEDDYDSEFRYAGRPLTALQGLDAEAGGDQCVVYLGTFSKVLFPSLRLGYLILPQQLVEPMTGLRAALDDHPSAVSQPALAAFFEEGHFAAHVRRMRTLYAARRECLLAAAARDLTGLLAVEPDEAGLHVVARLAPELAAQIDDTQASAAAAQAGLSVPALSSYYLDGSHDQSRRRQDPARCGLMLGYAAVAEEEIERGIQTLAAALATAARCVSDLASEAEATARSRY